MRRVGREIILCYCAVIAGALSLACSLAVHAQTKWFKYEGNPILRLGPPGSWDAEWIHIDRVILQDSVYRMWYSGGWKKVQIGYATSRDGITWKKYASNPVLAVRPGTWERNVHRGYVILAGSTYHMWYTGDDVGTFHLGYARSSDGIRWRRWSPNPVLGVGRPGSWDDNFAALVSVLGPDSLGGFKLWYQGRSYRIGYATASDETTWTKQSEPVFQGKDGAWYPRVMFNGSYFEMWCGMRDPDVRHTPADNPQPGVIGYATSTDGVHWTESPESPVLRCGPDGSWEDGGIQTGDVLSDGELYHMWYNADDGSNRWKGGYAISPKGMTVYVSASNTFVTPGRDTVRVAVRLPTTRDLMIFVCVRTGTGYGNPGYVLEQLGMHDVAVLPLYDDGRHGDSLAADGLFANAWLPVEEHIYFADLTLRLRTGGIGTFRMDNAAVFTTIGPVRCERVEYRNDRVPRPGDTVFVRLTLRNKGASSPARAVSASLSSGDASICSIADASPAYGDIAPGSASTTVDYYRVFVNAYAPSETDAPVNITISSWGIPLWHDTFTIHVSPPWWHRTWASALFALVLVGAAGGTVRLVEVRRLKRKIERLEQEQALDRERARISQEMHDEVGSTLTEIAILSELAQKHITNPGEANAHLQQISERAADVIGNIGEIIWAMNPRNNTLDNLLGYLRRDVSRYLALANIRFTWSAPDSILPGQVSSEARRNIFLVVKEAVHNAVKHSHATEVSVAVRLGAHDLDLTISDNGRGFDPNRVDTGGNGLTNMKDRMADIGGLLDIHSKPEEGTTVALSLHL